MYLDWQKNAKDYWTIDTEADGLTPSRFWCAVCRNLGSDELLTFGPEDMAQGGRFVEFLRSTARVVGHNFISYDRRHISRLLGYTIPLEKVVDTLVLSYLYHPHLPDGHSLDAYGNRFGLSKLGHDEWDRFSPDMLRRCTRDVDINALVYKGLSSRMTKIGFSEKSCQLEHEIRDVIDRQEARGFYFDQVRAAELRSTLRAELEGLEGPIRELFPATLTERGRYRYRLRADGQPYSSYTRHLAEYDAVQMSPSGDEYSVWSYQDFDIGSPQQRVKKLLSLGWEPTELTPAGNPKVDEDQLKRFADESKRPEILAIADWLVRSSRMSTIDSWTSCVRGDSRIHGTVFTCGAGTRRMRHRNPNCVPLSSQALTRNGWKSYDELVVGEDILAYDMKTRTKKWTPLLKVSVFPEAEIYSFGQKHPRKRLYCTKNHTWVWQSKGADRSEHPGEKLVEAQNIHKNSRIRINAPFDNDVIESDFNLIQEKYERDWVSEVCKLSDVELNAMMQGFLLADGCRVGGTWQFAQAEGNLLDAFLTCLYLISDTRVSAVQKRPLAGPNQRMGYNVSATKNTFMRTKDMSLTYEGVGPVWCPTTAFGTWVMKQGDFITITGNTANVPSVGKAWLGAEMRSLWTATPGRVLMGYDASGLEMRGFVHYVSQFVSDAEREQLLRQFVTGKPHQKNADAVSALGLPCSYDTAKTLFYAFLYGAGDRKLGLILKGSARDGGVARKALLASVPGLRAAVEAVQGEMNSTGGLIRTVDGGFVRCPGDHAALNYQIQSAGGIVMKKASVIFDRIITERGLDVWKVGDIHDESQQDCDQPATAKEAGQEAVKAIQQAGEDQSWNVPLTGEFTIGSNWAETH